MGVQIIDPKEIALREKKRAVVMNTRKLHTWVHYYPKPGDHDELHCHNEDQVFTCLEGECTMRFPDGGLAVLKPGMAALITGGSFYQLENTGRGHMILMGHRSGKQDTVMHIDYVTRQALRKTTGPKVRNRMTDAQNLPANGSLCCRFDSLVFTRCRSRSAAGIRDRFFEVSETPFFFRKIWGQHRHVFWQRYAVARAELVALQNRRATNVADVSISTV